ncbi:MAG: sulfur carrier protein ThiS [Porphyromonas sp.]|nr:sulfur carrier protein ThiS [Porphyromonas sp.]
MQITLNREPIEIPENCSLETLLKDHGWESGHVAVAINKTIIKRTAWAETVIRSGDDILIIGAVRGG